METVAQERATRPNVAATAAAAADDGFFLWISRTKNMENNLIGQIHPKKKKGGGGREREKKRKESSGVV